MNSSQSYRIAVIDLGSNTARLVVMVARPGYAYRLEDEIREVVRLRQEMSPAGLSEAAMSRAIATLRLFKRFCTSTHVDIILPTATSAVREAANGPIFLERVLQEVGLPLRLLDGSQEAYYATLGALNEVPMSQGLVLDMGGGSIQLSWVEDGRFQHGTSLTLGALALTERFVHHDPISEDECQALGAEIARQLASVAWLKQKRGAMLIGVGGTIRNLARIEAARQAFPLQNLHGFVLTRDSVAASLAQFCELPLARRQRIDGLQSDRADIITPGTMVLLAVLDRLKLDHLHISLGGLREGVFFERFWQHLPYPVIPDVRHFSVLNLARSYDYLKLHANHVRFLAGRLFDQLVPLHGFGPAERELLDAAALLHDLGTLIGYEGHHRHSQTLIDYNGLPGFTPREVAIVALLARYHRKGKPDGAPYQLVLQEGDEMRISQLSAILRVAEFLERGRNATVDDVSVSWSDAELRLTLIADEYPAVELWETERNALPLLEKAFQRQVRLDSLISPGEWLPDPGRGVIG